MNSPKIYLSPINNAIATAAENMPEVGFIVSLRQHNNSGGYVSESIISQAKKTKNVLERDHFCLKEYNRDIIEFDAKLFDIIHVDPWYYGNYNLDSVKTWLKSFLEENENLKFEFGTEDFIKRLEIDDYTDALNELSEYHDSFTYLVCQGGSVVFDLQNVSAIDVKKTTAFVELAKERGLKVKRHNCDFHIDSELALLADLGIEAYNFAPEFTFINNKIISEKLDDRETNIINEDIIRRAPWERWLYDCLDIEKNLLSCLHYVEDNVVLEQAIEESQAEITEQVKDRINTICKIIS